MHHASAPSIQSWTNLACVFSMFCHPSIFPSTFIDHSIHITLSPSPLLTQRTSSEVRELVNSTPLRVISIRMLVSKFERARLHAPNYNAHDTGNEYHKAQPEDPTDTRAALSLALLTAEPGVAVSHISMIDECGLVRTAEYTYAGVQALNSSLPRDERLRRSVSRMLGRGRLPLMLMSSFVCNSDKGGDVKLVRASSAGLSLRRRVLV